MVTVAKIARLHTGLGLGEFARKHGFPETTLCQVERGRMAIPCRWRRELSRALGVPLDELCDERGLPRVEKARS